MNNFGHYDNLDPYRANAGGILGGLDYNFCSQYYLGAGVGYTHTNLHWRGHHGSGIINSYYGALYASYQGSLLTVDLSAIGGGSHHSLRRKIFFLDETAHSDPWGQFVTGHLGCSLEKTFCQITFEPFGLIDYHYFHRDAFKERGTDTAINLAVNGNHQHMLRSEAGLKLYYTTSCNTPCWECDSTCFAPYLALSWVGEYPLGKSMQKASFVGQTCVMDITSYKSSAQLISPQAGFQWSTNCGFSLIIGYKGLYNKKTSINEIEGRLQWLF